MSLDQPCISICFSLYVENRYSRCYTFKSWSCAQSFLCNKVLIICHSTELNDVFSQSYFALYLQPYYYCNNGIKDIMRVYIDGICQGKRKVIYPALVTCSYKGICMKQQRALLRRKWWMRGKETTYTNIADPLPWHVSIVFPKIQNAITIGVITSISARINTMDRDNPDILFV